MTSILVSDEQAAALTQRAAERGLTLEEWLAQLAASGHRKPKYTLEELVAQCDPNAPLSEEDRAWLDAPPVGREVL
jgi:antitoxin ChpS